MFKTKQELHKERTEIAEGLSAQYAPVSTELLLMPFTNRGWYVHKKRGSGLGKQQVTLRNDHYKYSNGDFLTIECWNSFDGSGALVLMGGYGRVVCSNGLVIGDIEGARFVHRGTKIYEKLENQYEAIVAKLEDIRSKVETLQTSQVNAEQVEQAIMTIAKETFEVDSKTKRVEVLNVTRINSLVRVRREGDVGTDAFTVMNRVQESIVRLGNLSVKIKETDKATGKERIRYSSKRPTEHNVTNVAMNKRITAAFLKVCA